MFFLLLLAVLALVIGLVSVHVMTFWTIHRRGKNALWWWGAGLSAVIGALSGFVSGVWVRWRPEPNIEYVGFPIPGMMLLHEDGRWIDYVGPTILICPLLNTLLGATALLIPISLALLIRR